MDPVLLNALAAGIVSALMAGLVGPVVVTFRMSLLAGGLSHIAYGGVGLAYLLGFSPSLGALMATLGASMALSRLDARGQERLDAAVSSLWSLAMALGVIFVSMAGGYGMDLSSPLFGNLLTVSDLDLWVMGVLTLFCGLVLWRVYPDLMAVAYDEEFAQVRGIRPLRVRLTVLVLASLAVVVLMRSVGLILCMALLAIPPYGVERMSRSLKGMMGLSCLYGLACVLAGIWGSWVLDLPSGPCIVLVACVPFGLGAVLGTLRRRRSGS